MPSEVQVELVVKVGGSLYDLPDLADRLQQWLDARDSSSILLVPGGGRFANAVRELDAIHQIGEEAAHWLALRTLSVAAQFLASILKNAIVIGHPRELHGRPLSILDAHSFAERDRGKPGELPHSWRVTSDSIAARVAHMANARHLVLLKSVTIPEGTDWREARRRGWVDEHFAEAVGGLKVSTINWRMTSPDILGTANSLAFRAPTNSRITELCE